MSNNDITGARLVSKANDKKYEDGYDLIFGKKDFLVEDELPKKGQMEFQFQYKQDEKVEND